MNAVANASRSGNVERVSQRPTAVVAIPDASARQHAITLLEDLRWAAAPAASGAQAFAELRRRGCQALLLDSWLPDLDVGEFVEECRARYPLVDVVVLDDQTSADSTSRHPRRQELLYVLRQTLQDQAAGLAAIAAQPGWSSSILAEEPENPAPTLAFPEPAVATSFLPEFIGSSEAMRQLTRLIRLVAPRRTPVLIEGPTGTGKELTARAIHRLSPRARKPMVVLNCAAIPESLLEAEMFGHTRGAFTGAVASRVGRIEAADGGTLFLDEIGEMPLPLQSKLLRFVECGELQRVGENEPVHVDVRVLAATNQPLPRRVADGAFRADLYYRLSVFPISTPTLSSHSEDIPTLAQFFLKQHAQTGPAKQFSEEAMRRLLGHSWPGNVRELEHCIERAYILADESPIITPAQIQFGNF